MRIEPLYISELAENSPRRAVNGPCSPQSIYDVQSLSHKTGREAGAVILL